MQLSEISYPVYKLGAYEPNVSEDGMVTYYHTIFEDAEGVKSEETYVVDDKSAPGNTLGMRRLQLLNKGTKLFKLNTAIFFVGDLLKLAGSKTWFIDSSGKHFKYTKSKWAKLEYRRITRVIPQQGGGAIIELEGIPNRFKVLYAPTESEIWAQVLKYGMQYIFYGVTNVLGTPSKRMI